MNNGKRKDKKHDLFYDKIKDYHLGKLRIERQSDLKYDKKSYSSEYNRLVKAKKDIKDKIKTCLDDTLVFCEIVRMGEYSQSSRKHDPEPQIQKLDLDTNLKKYELTGDEGSVRHTISDEAKEFVNDIFDKKTVERLLSAIFFHGYHKTKDDEKHRSYRINIAKIMVENAINELEANLDSPYAKFLSEDLRRALVICNMIDEHK